MLAQSDSSYSVSNVLCEVGDGDDHEVVRLAEPDQVRSRAMVPSSLTISQITPRGKVREAGEKPIQRPLPPVLFVSGSAARVQAVDFCGAEPELLENLFVVFSKFRGRSQALL